LIRELFNVEKALTTALKWKEEVDMLHDPAVEQLPSVEEVEMSGCEKISQCQLYQHCDPMDQKECDVVTKSSEEYHVQTVQVSQESVCSHMISEQEDLDSESNDLRTSVEDQDKQETTTLSSKRT
jgi:hypothetical protein